MEQGQLHWIANSIWGIADVVLRDLYVRGKYRDVILPMTVRLRDHLRQAEGLGVVGLAHPLQGAPR